MAGAGHQNFSLQFFLKKKPQKVRNTEDKRVEDLERNDSSFIRLLTTPEHCYY